MVNRFIIQGNSMKPALRAGDIVVVENIDANIIKPGNVIVFKLPHQDECIIHRVKAIRVQDGERLLVTQGDNLPRPDEPVRPEWVLGRVAGRYVNRRETPMSRLEEWVFLVGASAYRRLRQEWVFRALRWAMPVLYPLVVRRLLRTTPVRVGDRRLITLGGRVVGIFSDTPTGMGRWVHPVFQRVKDLIQFDAVSEQRQT